MRQTTRSNIDRQAPFVPKRPVQRRLSFILSGTALLLLPAAGQAAQFNLLSLSSLRQSAGLSYNYQDSMNVQNSGGKNSSTQHGFGESYSISSGYSILHPRLLIGDADLTLTADQEYNDRSSEGSYSTGNNRLSYKIQGVVLDRKPNPLNFNLSSALLTIRPPFSRTYTLDTKNESLTWNIRNATLPAALFISQAQTTSSGLENDVESRTQTVQVSVAHQAWSVSDTKLSVSMNSSEQTLLASGTTDEGKEATFDVSNALAWRNPRHLARKLDSRYMYRERSGRNDGVQGSFGSNLDWQIGKALDGRVAYSNSHNEDRNMTNDLQSLSGSLTQNFLRCLNVNLGGTMTKGSYSDGSDSFESVTSMVRYSNDLPQGSNLALSYSYSYGVQERKRTEINLNVLDSVAPAETYPQFLDLAVQNIDSGSVQIYLDAGRTVPYTDFSVVFSGAQTRLLLDSDPGVPRLYLSYSYRQSPDVTFSTTGQAVGSHLSLLANRYVLTGSYSWSSQKIISGSDLSASIGDSSHLRLGFEGKATRNIYSLNYSADKSTYSELQNVEGNWTHTLPGRGASLTTRAQDRYSWFVSTGEGRSKGWDNTLLLSTTYSRSLSQNAKGKAALGYYNLMTAGSSSNKLNLELSLEGNYGKTSVSLDTSANFGFSPGGRSRNQSVALNLRRMF